MPASVAASSSFSATGALAATSTATGAASRPSAEFTPAPSGQTTRLTPILRATP